ncbi:hypothetical protein AMECASPLE_017696 [Ameca splendens]|uniref:Secreted protein n=1 Tax=Ameca splendens TaxID=208324 RepID=A0ABV0XRL6_9TELE
MIMIEINKPRLHFRPFKVKCFSPGCMFICALLPASCCGSPPTTAASSSPLLNPNKLSPLQPAAVFLDKGLTKKKQKKTNMKIKKISAMRRVFRYFYRASGHFTLS